MLFKADSHIAGKTTCKTGGKTQTRIFKCFSQTTRKRNTWQTHSVFTWTPGGRLAVKFLPEQVERGLCSDRCEQFELNSGQCPAEHWNTTATFETLIVCSSTAQSSRKRAAAQQLVPHDVWSLINNCHRCRTDVWPAGGSNLHHHHHHHTGNFFRPWHTGCGGK